jgi:hypothetical protein
MYYSTGDEQGIEKCLQLHGLGFGFFCSTIPNELYGLV